MKRLAILFIGAVIFVSLLHSQVTGGSYAPRDYSIVPPSPEVASLVRHADVTNDSVTMRYYVRDNLGSTRVVIDENNMMLHATNYYPSGLPYSIVDGEPQTDRLHTGKPFIDHNGMGAYDNSARILNSIFNEFDAADPMSEKYPNMSHYVNCANNTMKFVDPDGKDIWYIDDRGEIKKREGDKTIDKFIMVGRDKNPILDDNGNEVSISFDYGTIINQQTRPIYGHDNSFYDVYKVRGDENGMKLFEFMSKHITGSSSMVEMGLVQTGIPREKGLNFITTGHEKGSEPGLTFLYTGQLYNKYTINKIIHSHPISDRPSNNDITYKDLVIRDLKSNELNIPIFQIYSVPINDYINF